MLSKSQVDKAGAFLRVHSNDVEINEEYIKADEIFNEFRISHLEPLTNVTLKIQSWLETFSDNYYIAQRLKRRPQILRKLNRLNVRLSQLQDIGGCRIIVENNDVVDDLIAFIKSKLARSKYFKIKRITDYRENGRDITGYRAVHIIVERGNKILEIQLRSQLQHYWAESIERVSIIYRRFLKEMDGDPIVLEYFKAMSDLFHVIEKGKTPLVSELEQVNKLRERSEDIIKKSDSFNVLNCRVNEKFLLSMKEKEKKLKGNFHNWMLVFNWSTGDFQSWNLCERNISIASERYAGFEKTWCADDGYEVVMIGATSVETIKQTHSHYFGLQSYDKVLESLDESLTNVKIRYDIDYDCRNIIQSLYSKKSWGGKKVSIDTLKNHFCKDIKNNILMEKINRLVKDGFLLVDAKFTNVSLNTNKRADIMEYIQ